MPQIIRHTLLDFPLSLLSPYDETNCIRLSSRRPSEFVVPIWLHEFYETLFWTPFWVCFSRIMQKLYEFLFIGTFLGLLSPYDTTFLWEAFIDYLLILLSPYDATNGMRRSSILPSEFFVPIWCHKLYNRSSRLLFEFRVPFCWNKL